MSERQAAVPDPPARERMNAQETAPTQLTDLVAVKLTDTGCVRPHNEDYVDFFVPSDPQQQARKGAIYLVADGMGGHQAGEVASQGAVELVIQHYYEDTSRDVTRSLVKAVQTANRQIYAQGQADLAKAGMGTTLVAAVILGRKAYVANVGDSRAYLINERSISQITEDHSWVEEQVRAGLLTQEQAKHHPQRNLVTRALGSKPAVDVDLFEGEISSGDTLLLCSDGLTGRVEDHEIATIVRAFPPMQATQALVTAAKEQGGNDNITVLLVSAEREAAVAPVMAGASGRPARGRSWLIPVLVAGVAIVALILGALWTTGILSGEEPKGTTLPPTATATYETAPGTGPTSKLLPTSTGLPSDTSTRPDTVATQPSISRHLGTTAAHQFRPGAMGAVAGAGAVRVDAPRHAGPKAGIPGPDLERRRH